MRSLYLSLVFIFLAKSNNLAAMPPWAEISQRRTGDILSVVCTGKGISLDLARNNCLKSCIATAANQVVDTATVKTLSIETESDVTYHQEVKQVSSIKGLRCVPKNEAIEETNEGGYKVWIICEFDLSKVKASEIAEDPSPSGRVPVGSIIKNKNDVQRQDPDTLKIDSDQRDKQTRLSVSTIPMCDMILIRGKQPRSIRCEANPQVVIAIPGDREMIVRAKGRKPKTVMLENAGEIANERISIIFD